jgi:hypothetical protein
MRSIRQSNSVPVETLTARPICSFCDCSTLSSRSDMMRARSRKKVRSRFGYREAVMKQVRRRRWMAVAGDAGLRDARNAFGSCTGALWLRTASAASVNALNPSQSSPSSKKPSTCRGMRALRCPCKRHGVGTTDSYIIGMGCHPNVAGHGIVSLRLISPLPYNPRQ